MRLHLLAAALLLLALTPACDALKGAGGTDNPAASATPGSGHGNGNGRGHGNGRGNAGPATSASPSPASTNL